VVTVGLAGASSANASATPTHADPFAVPNPSAQLRTEEILPTDTDPEIDVALEPHYVVFDPSIRRQNQLFLFLTGGCPSLPSQGRNATTLISKQAAANGFHSINLNHVTCNAAGNGIPQSCGGDDLCWERNRLAVIYGGKTEAFDVSRANSIESRLLKLLSYLAEQHPEEGWSGYLHGKAGGDQDGSGRALGAALLECCRHARRGDREDGQVQGGLKWSSIMVAGWSQGAGHAPLIARDHEVARVMMLEGPADRRQVNPPANPARWLFEPHATPSARYFGLAHVRGLTSVPGAQPGDPFYLESAWQALGIDQLGQTVLVDTATPPFNDTHQLITNLEPDPKAPLASRTHHHSVAADTATPKDASGRPILAVVWQYMMFAPEED
jgi:hypothetical protein